MSPLPPDFRELAGSVSGLTRPAVAVYTPIVEDIVRCRSTDARHVEHTLDGLLAFGFDPTALPLSKTLCRHDASIDPAAAGYDVHAYGEMRDSEPEAPP